MNSIIMSDERSDINKALLNNGFKIIPSEVISEFISFERRHADMQCLRIKDTFFVLKNCNRLIVELNNLRKEVITTSSEPKGKYPGNVLLNAVYMNKRLYCNEKALDCTVKEYCRTNEIEIINVKQGYAKCSTAVFNNSFITSDNGIFNKMTERGEKGLLIEPGDIELPGTNYGFIGGCAFQHNNYLYFSGDIRQHKSYDIINDFCIENKIKIKLLTNRKLYDIGGFIVI